MADLAAVLEQRKEAGKPVKVLRLLNAKKVVAADIDALREHLG